MEKKIEKIINITSIVNLLTIIASIIWILVSKQDSIIPFYLLTISFLIALIIIILSFIFKSNKYIRIICIAYLIVLIAVFLFGPAFKPCAGCQTSTKCEYATQCKQNNDNKTYNCHYYNDDGSVSKDTITCDKAK